MFKLKDMNFNKKIISELRDCPHFRKITQNLAEGSFIVAGGFLSDKYLSERFGVEYKSNDIDLFVINDFKNKNIFRTRHSTYNMKDKYASISDTKINNIYNIIYLDPSEDGRDIITKKGLSSFWEDYIENSFDINLCMIYIDFKNDIIKSTKSFSLFEESLEIKIVGSRDMFNSYARLCLKSKKYKECNLKFYKEKWLEILFYLNAGSHSIIKLEERPQRGRRYFNFSKFVGERGLDLIDIFSPMIIVNVTRNKPYQEAMLGLNWLSVDDKVYKMYNKIHSAVIGSSGHNYGGINFNQSEVYHKKDVEILLNVLSGTKPQKVRNIFIAMSNIFVNQVIFCNEFKNTKIRLNKDIKESLLVELSVLFTTHSNLAKTSTIMLIDGWSLEEILLFFNKVNNMKKHKDVFIGSLESQYQDVYRECVRGIDRLDAFVVIYNKFISDRNKNDIKLTEELGLSLFKFNSYVEEIVSRNKLEDEGSFMKHCVGGYDHRVRSNYCKIFHLKYKDYESTLEVFMNNNLVSIKQHYTFQNKKVNMVQRALATSLINFLNEEYCKEKLFNSFKRRTNQVEQDGMIPF
jgi:hypothetical protein